MKSTTLSPDMVLSNDMDNLVTEIFEERWTL